MFATTVTLFIPEADARRVEDEVGSMVPDGLIAHVAGPVPDGGWHIVDIWESKEHCDAFRTQHLEPAVARATAGLPAPARPAVAVDVTGVLERRGKALASV